MRRTLAVVLLATLMSACASSETVSRNPGSFFDDVLPQWVRLPLRDDYMGKRFLQPSNISHSTAHDELGKGIPSPSKWYWPRKGWWPWPLPLPSPAQ